IQARAAVHRETGWREAWRRIGDTARWLCSRRGSRPRGREAAGALFRSGVLRRPGNLVEGADEAPGDGKRLAGEWRVAAFFPRTCGPGGVGAHAVRRGVGVASL